MSAPAVHYRRAHCTANPSAPMLVTMAVLFNMESEIHRSRILQEPDRNLLMLHEVCLAYAMRLP